MTDSQLLSLLTVLAWSAVALVAYTAVLFAVDALITEWQQRRAHRRVLQARLAQVDAETNASVRRLAAAFVLAQREIRRTSEGRVGRG